MAISGLSFYSNVFGLLIGGLSILGAVVGYCQSHLPSHQIKVLEDLLEETQSLYENAVEEGFLPNDTLRSEMEARLAVLRERMLQLRPNAYGATTLLKDYKELFRGVSYHIGLTCFHVKDLRASVIATSEAERRRICVHGDDHRTIPQSSRAVEMGSDPRPQSHSPDNLHAEHTTHVIAPHEPCDQHDGEVDSIELHVLYDSDFPGGRLSLVAASIDSDGSVTSTEDTSGMELKVLPEV